MKYFIVSGKNKIGPLSLTEVREYIIERNTLLWKEGLEEWKSAEDFEELQDLFHATPPPVPGVIEPAKPIKDLRKQAHKDFGKILFFFMISAFIAVLTLIVYSSANQPDYVSSESVEEGKREMAEIRKSGNSNPVAVGSYIPSGKYSYGFLLSDIESGRINDVVKSRFQEDVKKKTLLSFALSFGIQLVGYFTIKGIKKIL